MKALGRVAIWIAIFLLLLAAISWAGIVLVAAHYFLVPAIALLVFIAFLTMVIGSHKKSVDRAAVNRAEPGD